MPQRRKTLRSVKPECLKGTEIYTNFGTKGTVLDVLVEPQTEKIMVNIQWEGGQTSQLEHCLCSKLYVSN